MLEKVTVWLGATSPCDRVVRLVPSLVVPLSLLVPLLPF